jgi:hypothetical protein
LRHGKAVARASMTREIVASIVAEVGYGPDAAMGMRNSVRANLQYLVKQSGTVVRLARVPNRAGL